MKIRYQEFKEGKDRWLYDIQKDKLYVILDSHCVPCKFNIVQLSKFRPYAKKINEYVMNPYKEKS